MLTTDLLARSLGDISPYGFAQSQEEQLLRAIQPAPLTRFSPSAIGDHHGEAESWAQEDETEAIAHKVGVNVLAIDKFEGRYLISGGADAQLLMWDLETGLQHSPGHAIHKPIGVVPKSDASHKFGITGVSFYPFDSLAFLSSSYDHNLKMYSSETMSSSVSFDLGSVVYAHAMSPIADHLLVACATQHPAVRLVDLRSGSATHSLVGHTGGSVLSVAWSPKQEQILASGGADGTVRFWDIRRSAGCLGTLDKDDSIGSDGFDGYGTGARRGERGKAHAGPVNGILWNETGEHLVTAGHDEQVRVWNTRTAANTLTNFGPLIRNKHLSSLLPTLVPQHSLKPGHGILFYPNEREILMYELFEGSLLKRLKIPGVQQNDRVSKSRVTSLVWRPHSIELLSGHTDGTIRSWQPRTSIDAFVDDGEELESERASSGNKRKRQTLDEIHRDLTTRKVTFT